MKSKRFLIAVIVLVMLLLVVKPSVYIESARSGLLLFCTSVLPALFPFFFFGTLLAKLGAADSLGKLCKKPISALFLAPPCSAYIFVMSLLSGYPVGAKLTADFFLKGSITEFEARRVCTFTSTSGPLFVLGTVGSVMIGDRVAGAIILVCHYFSAVLIGILTSLPYRRKKSEKQIVCRVQDAPCNSAPPSNILSDTVTAATATMLLVGGYICIFNVLVDAVSNLGIFGYLARLLHLDRLAVEAVGSGAIEMTRGCLLLSKSSIDLPLKYALISFLITFGGVGILIQSYTFLANCRIKFGYFLLTKFLQASICFLLVFGIFSIIYS